MVVILGILAAFEVPMFNIQNGGKHADKHGGPPGVHDPTLGVQKRAKRQQITRYLVGQAECVWAFVGVWGGSRTSESRRKLPARI